MNSYHDYESMGMLDFSIRTAGLCEAFAGTSVVSWHGRIERQLVNLLNDAEKGRNYAYADKLREFLKIWRANEITGSINRETLEILKSASDILSVDQWNLATYFGSLKDQLKVLIASEEQLPRGMEEPGNDPFAGGGGGRGAPPMSPAFGPKEKPPGGMEEPALGKEPPAGQEGEESAGEGAPVTPPEAPAPEETEEESAEPEAAPGSRLGLA